MKKFVFLLSILLCSCSLKYTETVDVEDTVPELIFENSTVIRYEDNKITLKMQAEVLEQYIDSSESYGKNVEFISFNDGEIETQGKCGLLLSDSDKELYELYDDIELFNFKENMNFYANVLRWNAKSEQLTSASGEMVKIEKDDTVIRGTGFSASGISKTFSFRGNVTGEIETEEDEHNDN